MRASPHLAAVLGCLLVRRSAATPPRGFPAGATIWRKSRIAFYMHSVVNHEILGYIFAIHVYRPISPQLEERIKRTNIDYLTNPGSFAEQYALTIFQYSKK